MLRTMKNAFNGKVFYDSTFDTTTGTLARLWWGKGKEEEESEGALPHSLFNGEYPYSHEDWVSVDKQWSSIFSWRRRAFSPVPELLDISITSACGLNCPYCYQNSKVGGIHAPADLIERVIKDFDQPPYQIAIGGGEPTEHPNLPEMLLRAAELGTVPNYCTNGLKFADKGMEALIEATNQACGSIAVTFHDSTTKNFSEIFQTIFKNLKRVLKVPINVHLIVDCAAVEKLEFLVKLQESVGPLNVLLLAYFPAVGRASYNRLIRKHHYNVLLPDILRRAQDSGMKIGFSEGLLPYFLSRPEIVGVKTDYATRSSGLFSAYVDMFGRLSAFSFDPPPKEGEPDEWTLEHENPEEAWKELLARHPVAGSSEKALQQIWNKLHTWHENPAGVPCYGCCFSSDCVSLDIHHSFLCAFMPHNGKDPILSAKALKKKRLTDALFAISDFSRSFQKAHGREPTDAEMRDLVQAAELALRGQFL